MRFSVLTLHPEQITGPTSSSILGRASQAGLIAVEAVDIRTHGLGKHRSVDDTPYGGGPGMVMRVDVVAAAIAEVRTPESHVVLLSAGGQRFDQAKARRLACLPHLVLVCGHYEGIDARVESLVDEEISLGDFVLTGGEIAALAIVDAVARLLPGVLGNALSPADESFSQGLLEYPQYTRPQTWQAHSVPEILLSGHHERIAAWRRSQALQRTRARRPDLLQAETGTPSVDDERPLD